MLMIIFHLFLLMHFFIGYMVEIQFLDVSFWRVLWKVLRKGKSCCANVDCKHFWLLIFIISDNYEMKRSCNADYSLALWKRLLSAVEYSLVLDYKRMNRKHLLQKYTCQQIERSLLHVPPLLFYLYVISFCTCHCSCGLYCRQILDVHSIVVLILYPCTIFKTNKSVWPLISKKAFV